jgi:uncharacterized glyoxalase superfamily protein PhnB
VLYASDRIPNREVYVDAHAAIAWLVDALGAERHAVHAADDGTIRHAELRFDNGIVMQDIDYGSREFSVRDPEGNSWHFGTYQPFDA